MNHNPIPSFSAPLELTGDVSGGAWAGVPRHGNFTRTGPSNPEPTPSASLAMAHDGQRLHLAVRCRATVIRRVDYRGGALASYRRGCDAVISRDNGQTWDVDHLYVLDDYPMCEGERWINGKCGHHCSALAPDASVLTSYGNYLAGAVLIPWSP
ncbi:MAG: hypothetical protein EXS18_07300 [Verrucomicrobiae bacterium]|nr:hypothetical protein [Verrucomicrobiae bacterium]